MRLDIVSIFPEFFSVLDLSLIGKANADGLLNLHVTNLRDYATDRHRTVDDTPLGGGAGMVMKPDVWGKALDEIFPEATLGDGERHVLIVPTPSGETFTQRIAEDLAGADHLVFACGRYEGIDFRVAQHYAERGVEVRELSIGDYVLNGGEVATVVMIEAIGRLLPGVIGNPDSLVEESHGSAGLLEYPVYTRPVNWRGQEVNPVLLSGDHAAIARLRRDQALEKTLRRRPDMIQALRPDQLDSDDRSLLARLGWCVGENGVRPLEIRELESGDVDRLHALAIRTFPDACPPFLSHEDIQQHLDTVLSPQSIHSWIDNPHVRVIGAFLPQNSAAPEGDHGGEASSDTGDGRTQAEQTAHGEQLVGYALVVGPRADGPIAEKCPKQLSDEHCSWAHLSKVYIDQKWRGSGIAAALIAVSADMASQMGATSLWTATSTANKRAAKSYKRAGMTKKGGRTYTVGTTTCRDVVMQMTLSSASPQ
ncbi:tRNA (guanosine(37)-N1)-methyltransferase TrmD [Actinomyces vulturis]|uniref:tRNA (guanosine(37)-N1)-methyltransferase TrmD n=1 Tax=Actinomyces vulturis TaxID=1857645 RepID=UPI00083159F7|nr:tRNA (guanosine(37)-N1)-methyltransferase TrmD [Actinomyces vulturis]